MRHLWALAFLTVQIPLLPGSVIGFASRRLLVLLARLPPRLPPAGFGAPLGAVDVAVIAPAAHRHRLAASRAVVHSLGLVDRRSLAPGFWTTDAAAATLPARSIAADRREEPRGPRLDLGLALFPTPRRCSSSPPMRQETPTTRTGIELRRGRSLSRAHGLPWPLVLRLARSRRTGGQFSRAERGQSSIAPKSGRWSRTACSMPVATLTW